MGKGGEKNADKKKVVSVTKNEAVVSSTEDTLKTTQTKSFKLSHMSTEELRKWSASYGEKDYDGDRNKLLEVLVI